jgi:uncharacterized membrane protein
MSEFSVSISPSYLSVDQGSSGSATATVTSLGDFSSPVQLDIMGLPSDVSASFSSNPVTPPAGASASSEVYFAVGTSVPAGSYPLTLTATAAESSQQDSLTLTVTSSGPPPDFEISVLPNSYSVPQGGSVEANVQVTSIGSFSSTVSLSSNGVPSGVDVVFSPSEVFVSSGASTVSTVTFTVNANVPAESYDLSLTGTSSDGGQTHSCTLEVIVTTSSSPDFVISLTSPSINIQQGTVGTNTLTINPVGGFFSTVYLSTNMIFPGISITFSPNQITPLPGASLTSRVSINVGSTVRAGTYSIPLLATTGSGGLSHIYTLTLIVTSSSFPDFTLTASSPALYIPQGSSGISTFTISSLSGFSSSVQLSASWLTSAPQGVTFTLPTPVTPLPNQSASSILTITTQPTSSTGTFVLRVTSSSGSLIHTADVNVQISGTSSTTTTMNPTTTVTSTTMVTTQATRDYTPAYAGIALVVIVLLGMGVFMLRRKRTTN